MCASSGVWSALPTSGWCGKHGNQGAGAGGAAGGGWEGDGAWGAHDIDLYKDLGPHYRAAEEDLPQTHVRRLPDMELLD